MSPTLVPAPDVTAYAGSRWSTVGLDLGGSKCAGVLLDASGVVIAERRESTPQGDEEVLATLERMSRTLLDVARVYDRHSPVSAVGVGLPGLVTMDGVLRFGPHLRGTVELPVGALLGARLSLPVRVANDNRAAAWAEHRVGAGAGVGHMLYVGLGTGIGGGVVSEGVLLGGAYGFATEIGHVVVDRRGEPCVCGRNGCWEMFASGSALGQSARRRAEAGELDTVLARYGIDAPELLGEHVTEAAESGDVGALSVLEEFAGWVALGLANLTMIFDPEMIVLGGGVPNPAAVVVEPVRRMLPRMLGVGSNHRVVPNVVGAALGARAGAVGAALLARDL